MSQGKLTMENFELRRGDFYLVTSDRFALNVEAQLQSDPYLKDDVAVYRLDGPAGTHASRPLEATDMSDALLKSAMLFNRSRQENVRVFGHLAFLLERCYRELESRISVGGFDDVLLYMQPHNVKRLIEQTQQRQAELAESIESTLLRLGEHYEYLLNVVIHNLLQTWSNWGDADRTTRIEPDIDVANLNIIIIPEYCDPKTLKETGEDAWLPALENWLSDTPSIPDDGPTVHIAPELSTRLGALNCSSNRCDEMQVQTTLEHAG